MALQVGALVEGTIEMVGTTATEHILGRVTAIAGERVTVEGMVVARRKSPTAVPVEVELPLTIALPKSAVVVL
jgi:hypothetical protein